MTSVVVTLNAPNATNELPSITVNCTIHPDSTADQCVVMAMADGRATRTGTYVSVATYVYYSSGNYIQLPYSTKLSRDKTFTVFVVFP